jgi:hypothetical protein
MGGSEAEYAIVPWDNLFGNAGVRGLSNLELTKEILAGRSHMDVVFTAYANGMKAVFSDRTAKIRTLVENYDACAGTYELGTERIRFTVRVLNKRLYISRSGEYWDELIPCAGDRFAVDANPGVQFSFVVDHSGRAAKMIIHQLGIETPAVKVE